MYMFLNLQVSAMYGDHDRKRRTITSYNEKDHGDHHQVKYRFQDHGNIDHPEEYLALPFPKRQKLRKGVPLRSPMF